MNAILLPIKTVYATRIYNGSKKYEFRKTLCNKDINRIYIYETAPVKKITGYVDVKGKIQYSTSELWSKTSASAGIDYDDFISYFSKAQVASAYVLGNAHRFSKEKTLEDFHLHAVPQSFAYVISAE